MAVVKLARHAMATRFEIVVCGDNPVSLRAAGEEALDEIDRLESQLSLFKPASEIARLNARAAHEAVRVTPSLFGLLEHACRLTAETDGAFDITIAPLVRCWGFMGGSGYLPQAEDLAAARQRVGMHLVELDRNQLTVRFRREGVMLDLGAIGKGYAVDRAIEVLHEAGVASALVHGGTSTVYGLGRPPETNAWRIEITSPSGAEVPASIRLPGAPADGSASPGGVPQPFATVDLVDQSLSVSAVWGKYFSVQGRNFGHVIDPRTGAPVKGAVLSAVVLPSATETDALSTALLTLGLEGHERISNVRPDIKTLVVEEFDGRIRAKTKGIEIAAVDVQMLD